MALTKAFFDAVNNRNVRRIRIMMEDSLLVDTSFKEFEEMETIVEKIPGLYDAHDGREFINDKSEWDDDYMNKQMVQLVTNFSHERINHLKDVICVLRSETRIASAADNNTIETFRSKDHHSYEEQKRIDQQNGTYKGAVMGGVVVGAVVGGVIATIEGVTVVGGAVVGAVIGGATGFVAVRGRR